jgi:hypothetical protein
VVRPVLVVRRHSQDPVACPVLVARLLLGALAARRVVVVHLVLEEVRPVLVVRRRREVQVDAVARLPLEALGVRPVPEARRRLEVLEVRRVAVVPLVLGARPVREVRRRLEVRQGAVPSPEARPVRPVRPVRRASRPARRRAWRSPWVCLRRCRSRRPWRSSRTG